MKTALWALALLPFGSVPSLLVDHETWHGFVADDPLLWVVRAQRVPGASCQAWARALTELPVREGIPIHPEAKGAGSFLETVKLAWLPWSKEELSDIDDCEKLPCNVKLDAGETARMAAVPETARANRFVELARERGERYGKTQERPEYEFPGQPIDPWDYFEKHGLKPDLPRPPSPSLWARRLDFGPGKIKVLHQLLDSRAAVSADGNRAALWVRDAYTDHYFDGWGELTVVSCEPLSTLVFQSLAVELDLLKKTDLVSRIMRPKMRAAMEEHGARYLDQEFERIRALVKK